ncbi:unnamed protein product, partial [Meganyctiphanes norvegica]
AARSLPQQLTMASSMLRQSFSISKTCYLPFVRTLGGNVAYYSLNKASSQSLGILQKSSCPAHSWKFSTERNIHISARRLKLMPFLLADIGEGIKEVVIKEWFVSEGDSVSEFDQICEVQSDKASVTITSRYTGLVRNLCYEVDDTALVGKPLVEIEIENGGESTIVGEPVLEGEAMTVGGDNSAEGTDTITLPKGKFLTTPAVRRIASEHN